MAAPTTRMVVDGFNEAFNRHDAAALATLLTDDTVFEDTSPAPDGRRIEGKAAVVAFWRAWFARNSDAVFEAEDMIVSGDRAVVRWVYRKLRNGQPWRTIFPSGQEVERFPRAGWDRPKASDHCPVVVNLDMA